MAPVAAQGKSMHLILVRFDLSRNVRLLLKNVLDLLILAVRQQAIGVSDCDGGRLGDGIEVPWDGHETGMACDCCIDERVSEQNGVSAAPAKTYVSSAPHPFNEAQV